VTEHKTSRPGVVTAIAGAVVVGAALAFMGHRSSLSNTNEPRLVSTASLRNTRFATSVREMPLSTNSVQAPCDPTKAVCIVNVTQRVCSALPVGQGLLSAGDTYLVSGVSKDDPHKGLYTFFGVVGNGIISLASIFVGLLGLWWIVCRSWP
jgi:hypothetical protein